MPKFIELTVEIIVQKVSCPGVWLCQDGRVSLTMFALGTSYQTCLLPPVFPLVFKDIFFFRKIFNETCALNNICCLLQDETIYCELVQWREDCMMGECATLAQYLGALCDILFPSYLCSNDGVDLLMRRAPDFPGILSPKIEISTKVRIDEIWNPPQKNLSKKNHYSNSPKKSCHTSEFHRTKCRISPANSRPRSHSRSEGSRSACSLVSDHINGDHIVNRVSPSPRRRGRPQTCYDVYNVTPDVTFRANQLYQESVDGSDAFIENRPSRNYSKDIPRDHDGGQPQKLTLESQYIEQGSKENPKPKEYTLRTHISPCVCEICKKYHEFFHKDTTS